MSRIDQILSLPTDSGFDVHEHVKEHHFGLYETMGRRDSQEDSAFACWYTEGHFDSLSPQEIGRRLWTSYHLINTLGRNLIWGGTTASTTVYDGRGNLISATLADSVSFAVVYDKNESLAGVVRLNSMIHHPNEELDRIQRAGGVVRSDRIDGCLAVSRAIGDFIYAPDIVCADASIDINRLEDIYRKINIDEKNVGKVQIITTCDGYTEPLATNQSKLDHELWLFKCLNEISLPSSQEEHQLAKMLATKAFDSSSFDNISIAVQTLFISHPFMMGIYDGHAGKGASIYTASHIGSIFDEQCSLSQKAYAQQALSADKNCVTYYRDNKDQNWYDPLAAELKKAREFELSRSEGVLRQLNLLKEKAKELENTNRFYLLNSVQKVYFFMKELCQRYIDLTLSDKEFVVCTRYILENSIMFEFKPKQYSFLGLNFKECKENAERIKKDDFFLPIMMNLKRTCFSVLRNDAIVDDEMNSGFTVLKSL